MINLKDKVVVITGGSGGIGSVTVKEFYKASANVAIWDLDKEKGLSLIDEIGASSDRIRFYETDTTKIQSTKKAAERTIRDFNKIDVLINNAGITRDASFKKMTPEQWQKVVDVNLTGVFNSTKAVYPYMEDENYGRIINVASVVAHNGNFGQTNYVATKSGVIGMVKTWAREFGRKGINVNAVAPGFINTDMIKTVPDDIINDLKDKTPLGRLGEAEDIANAYIFLSSDYADFITGSVINVDGGLVM